MPVAAPMTAEAGRPGRYAGGHHARACGNGQRAAAASVLAAESVAWHGACRRPRRSPGAGFR